MKLTKIELEDRSVEKFVEKINTYLYYLIHYDKEWVAARFDPPSPDRSFLDGCAWHFSFRSCPIIFVRRLSLAVTYRSRNDRIPNLAWAILSFQIFR